MGSLEWPRPRGPSEPTCGKQALTAQTVRRRVQSAGRAASVEYGSSSRVWLVVSVASMARRQLLLMFDFDLTIVPLSGCAPSEWTMKGSSLALAAGCLDGSVEGANALF